ncbi:MAG: cupin domain-containing protein [Selenomonadaceae bacterium]|nr:cupin domain-containing protein [Selenomonadaceae bacterium]
MQIILLSGGSGKRLWPLSNEIRSKQFIKIFETNTGHESMLQRVLKQIYKVLPQAELTVSTSETQKKILRKYVGCDVGISVEPCRRNTFPAIALTAAYLHEVKKINEEEPIVICPVDPYVNDDYFATFKKMADLVDEANLVLMGIAPTYPSEKYGYIIPSSKENVSTVLEFKEKPNAQKASDYIKRGGLWNGGVFACKLSYILEKSRENFKTDSYSELLKIYSELPNISIDYAVVEHEQDVKVVRYSGDWKDVGTWNTLTEVMSEQSIGKVYFDKACENSHVINETDMPIIAMGLKNIVVAAGSDGILVADKVQSSYIKPLAENIHEEIRYAEKSWGTYQVIDIGKESLTIKVILTAGNKMNYHSHNYRDEVWNFVEGSGRVNLNGEIKSVRAGDIVKIPAGVKHTVFAETNLKIIEVQIGKDITVEDKILWS